MYLLRNEEEERLMWEGIGFLDFITNQKNLSGFRKKFQTIFLIKILAKQKMNLLLIWIIHSIQVSYFIQSFFTRRQQSQLYKNRYANRFKSRKNN